MTSITCRPAGTRRGCVEARSVPERATVTCPHCQQTVSLRVMVTVAAEPPLRVRFETSEDFRSWLHASRLTISEFREMPIYRAYQEQFDPLIDKLFAQEDASGATPAPMLLDALRPRPARDHGRVVSAGRGGHSRVHPAQEQAR